MITEVRVPFTGHRTIYVTHDTTEELEAKVLAYIDADLMPHDGVQEAPDDDRDDYPAVHIAYTTTDGNTYENTPYYYTDNDGAGGEMVLLCQGEE